jgi:transcriptional regulator with GAF, ATPase, and Fis domain
MTAMCESVRGEWGQPCPDCGQTLPNPGPIRSSWTNRSRTWPGAITERRWSPEARATREATFRAKAARRANTGLRGTDRLHEIVRIVAKNGGNQKAAARELGIASPTVTVAMKRARKLGLTP